MIHLRYLLAVLLLSLTAKAQVFQPASLLKKTVSCKLIKNEIQVEGLSKPYAIFEDNSKITKLAACQRIEISGLVFYTFSFENEISQDREDYKVLTFELAALDKKLNTIKTVRSEEVDEIMISGDPVKTSFKNTLAVAWGKNKKTGEIMLKVQHNEPKEKPLEYLLKYNAKAAWFENIF